MGGNGNTISPDDLDALLNKDELYKSWVVTQIYGIKKDIDSLKSKYDRLERIMYMILSVIITASLYMILHP